MQAAARREKTITELDQILERRRPDAPVSVLGAGSDDLEPGRSYLSKLATGGYAVPRWPVEHGGMGLPFEEAAAVRNALAVFDAPDLYPWMVGLDLVGPTILAHGNDEQKDRWLPDLRSGEQIWCQMFSEPDAGSDLAALKARATRDGDGWRVSGSKVWTSRAHYARFGLLLARHDSSLPKHKGITAFGLDLTAAGVTVKPLVQMNRDAHFNEVFLDDVWIPDSDRIDEVGAGWKVGITCLSFERGALGGGLGVTEEQVERLGRMISPADGVRRDQWTRLYCQYRVNQWSTLRAEEARKAGKPPGPEDSMSKLWGTSLVKGLADLAMSVRGPAGLAGDGTGRDEWQDIFLMSPSLSIRGGTNEIQHNILGERVLGLPAEPRLDKDKPFSETI